MFHSKRVKLSAFWATAGCFLVLSSAAQAEDLTLCAQGWSATVKKDYSKALPLYDQCMQTGDLSPASLARTYRNIAITYQEMGRAQVAIDYEDKALALHPADAWNDHVNRGNAASDLGRFDEALADYDKAATLQPDLADIHYNRGIVYERLQQIDKAKAEFLEADRKGLRSSRLRERMARHQLTPSKVSTVEGTPAFTRFTEVLSAKLETDALSALSRRAFMDLAMTICPRVSKDVTEALKTAVSNWDQRNALHMQAARSVIQAFEARHRAVLDQAAEKAYADKVVQATASHAMGELRRAFNDATPDNQIVPPEASCADLATWIAAGRVDFTKTPGAVRELDKYMQREKAAAP